MSGIDWFIDVCSKNNLTINRLQKELLDKYVAHLLNWNEKVNLISRRDEENIWKNHILGSISFLFNFSFKLKCTLVDIGTGGGLPGIPIAILQPDMRVILIDSIQKKIEAVNAILSVLDDLSVTAMLGRAEELATVEGLHNSFDYVVARAVGSVKDMIQWGNPFLKLSRYQLDRSKVGKERDKVISPGSIIMLKGGDLTGEIDKAKKIFNNFNIFSFQLKINGIPEYEFHDKKLVIAYPQKDDDE